MPRGKKKAREGPRRRRDEDEAAGAGPISDGDDSLDNASVASGHSEQSLALDGAAGTEEEVDDSSAQEDFEDRLKDAIDGISQKSAKGRTDCLKSLTAAFIKKYICDFLFDRKLTIMDGVERCLKKGRGEEQAAAARCAASLIIQLGASDDSEELFKDLRPTLQTILADQSMSCRARGACAEALGIGSFIAGGEREQVLMSMHALENNFKASYLKGDGTTPSHSPDVAAMHNSAMVAWSLLLSIAPESVITEFADSHLPKLPELLKSSDLDLRISTGETIALLYELIRETNEEFEGDDMAGLCETLKQLATDSNKYRAKKDRRTQRANFRDILHSIEQGEVPTCRVKFGTECMYIDSWTRKRQYDTLCQVLGSGMNVHLQENELLREIFGLGAPIPLNAPPTTKISKFERQMFNAAAFKARTKARSRFRDKRAVQVSS